jgi:hypothetical protein
VGEGLPLVATIETVTERGWPAVRVVEAGVTFTVGVVREGAEVDVAVEAELPPQPCRTASTHERNAPESRCGMGEI